MTSIPATVWNRLIDTLRRNQLLGHTALQRGSWRHPWQVTPRWDNELAQWVATIEPGFVNGQDATVNLPRDQAPEATLLRLNEQKEDTITTTVDCWLTEEPVVSLGPWRAIGQDANPVTAIGAGDGTLAVNYEDVPEFFRSLGVGQPPELSSQLGDQGLVQRISGQLADMANVRLLRATELVLQQDRFATSTQWETGLGVDGIQAQFSVTYSMPGNMRRRAYLRSMASWEEVATTPMQDRLRGDWTDTPHDTRHLATVYLMSLPGQARESLPDSNWIPFVRHHLFWNLVHSTNVLEPALARQNLVLSTGLAASLLDTIGNRILSTINDQNAAIAEFLDRNTLEGRFWST